MAHPQPTTLPHRPQLENNERKQNKRKGQATSAPLSPPSPQRAKANASWGSKAPFTAASSSGQSLSLPAITLAPDTWLKRKLAWRSV